MKSLPSRLRRHLSYANVMASIAVFVALGGVGYAATTINGNKIVKGTVGGAKLKNGTVTGKQVKANSLTGAAIEESSLGTVPSAQTAQTATSASTATTAGSADTAASAGTAKNAASAEHALTAEDADTLEGFTAEQLRVACSAETELFGGMCWDDEARPIENWIAASKDCGEAGGRLPSLSELVAYTLQDHIQIPTGAHWTGDIAAIGSGNEEVVFTRTETSSASIGAVVNSLGYRCLFYRVN